MDTLLLVITVGSLLFALAMCGLAWRLARDERRRTAARIAQLAAEAATAVPVPAASIGLRVSPVRGDRPESSSPAPSPTAAPMGSLASEPLRPARLAVASRDIEVDRHDELPLSSSFLSTPERQPESSERQRGLAVAAAVLATVLGGFVVYQMIGPGSTRASARTAAVATPLELLSLRHDRVGSRLSVSGLVKNPSTGQPVDRLYAVVFVFDQAGSFVTSGRAPVDFLRIAAGDESPFVVAIDAPQNVARYRVSFRTDAGTVPHVDKRGSPVATPAGSLGTVAAR